jgi:hypothetical protein
VPQTVPARALGAAGPSNPQPNPQHWAKLLILVAFCIKMTQNVTTFHVFVYDFDAFFARLHACGNQKKRRWIPTPLFLGSGR